jgi:membrane-associated HD superfamily phosphohydrolase
LIETLDEDLALSTTSKRSVFMKEMRILSCSMAMLLAAVPGAFASTTARVYSSSTLVLAFVGFLALIVVIQLIPAIMTLFGALKGLAKKEGETRMAKVRAGE